MRVLVIEDDQETATFLKRALKESGHVAEYAGDGQTGLDLARSNAYDVLIVDRMLPKCDGLAVIQALRTEEVRTPALILSALGEVDDRVKGLRAGGDDYLTKPYAFTELLARIEALGAAHLAGGGQHPARRRRPRARPPVAQGDAGRRSHYVATP